jgi:hypothetical protein
MNILRSYIFWSVIRLVRVIPLKTFFDVNLICILFIKDDDFRNTMKQKKIPELQVHAATFEDFQRDES